MSQLFLNHWFLSEEKDDHFSLASQRDDAIMARLADAARKHAVVLVCPFFEKKGDKHFSSAAVFDRDGSLAGVYQKLHIPHIPDWKEKYYFSPGEEGLPVFHTAYGRIGVQLCWDNFFPEPTRVLALKGAEIIFAPTAAAYASQERWYHVIAANAFVNNLFVFRVNRVGHDKGLDFYGESFCVNPLGEFIAEPVAVKENILMADVNLAMVQEVREQSGFFRDRQASLYTDLAVTE